MPDVLVRDIDADVLESMKSRAKKNGRSLQAELKLLIGSSVRTASVSDLENARRIKDSLSRGQFSDSAETLREDRAR